MYVVEGLEHGHIASITKTHHAAIDGVSGAELTVNLLDLQPEPAEVPPEETPWEPDRIPSDAELVAYAVNSLARQPFRAAKAVRRTALAAVNVRRRNRQPDAVPPPAPFSAPHTPFNVSIDGRRRFAFTEIPLDEAKMVKNALGGTVNDVVLALCAGALRSYLLGKGLLPEKGLVAMVPISVRSDEHKGAMGNRVSSMLTALATDLEDPLERLRVISAGTRQAKEQDKAIGADTLMDWTEFAAPALAARAARLYSRMKVADRLRPFFNVTISNVPGPPFPLYCAGARMVALYPMGPIADGLALNMTVMSYMGSMYFGLVAGRDAVPDVWDLAHGINQSLDELKKAADAAGRS
jgi:WS/DGAT/MGAT family acyltransferase